MSETITEYFRRFDNSITESLYSAITLEDFERNKAAMEYLDYDRETLFQRKKGFCGIRNVGNSCYLSVTLQILFNVQPLREKIFLITEENATEFLTELQRLFALMLKGSLIYYDPTNLFIVLKKLHPEVFVDGIQNDFHEVYTLILEELEKSFSNEDDKRFFKKMFYGRMKSRIVDEKRNIISGASTEADNSFNILNLVSENKNFESGLKKLKSENIEGYESDIGLKMKVTRENTFLETPALLSFFINRVSFKNNKLIKDTSEFDFEDKILFSKTTNSKINKTVDGQIEKQINALKEWIKNIQIKKQFLLQTISYLHVQEFNDIHLPSLINPNGLQAKENTKNYLKSEIEQIDLNVTKSQLEIIELENKRVKEAEENNTEVYYLWALMIHYGSTANSGHYKICIKANTEDNKWIEFNDRKSSEITNEKILEYKKKGEVCCLFYRRNTLQSHVEKIQITSSLKKYVQLKEQQIFKEIDSARILQALYQEFESINIIWDYQTIKLRQEEKISAYFFKPLLHLILKATPSYMSKGFLLYESIKDEKFVYNLKQKLIDQNREIKIPNLNQNFGVPNEYESISEGLKEFLCEEYKNPIEAYKSFSFYMDITINDPILLKYFTYLKQVLLLKGVFYESMFQDKSSVEKFEEFSGLMDKMVNSLEEDDPCTVIITLLRSAIREKYLNQIIENKRSQTNCAEISKKRLPSIELSSVNQMGPQILLNSFKFWIDQRQHIGGIDEEILKKYKEFYKIYYDA